MHDVGCEQLSQRVGIACAEGGIAATSEALEEASLWWLRITAAGKAIGMPDPTTWSIEYHVREDAESMFVPTELLPHAQPGDFVEIRSLQPAVTRRGRVSGPGGADPRDGFVTVTLD